MRFVLLVQVVARFLYLLCSGVGVDSEAFVWIPHFDAREYWRGSA